MLWISAAALLAWACAACGGDGEPAERSAPDAKRAQGRERPLPGFSGSTLAGEPFSVSSALGQRLLIFCFDPEDADAALVAEAVAKLSSLHGAHNFEILGVATGSSREAAQAFAARRALDFRVLDDSGAQIARRLGLRTPVAILGVDAEGRLEIGSGQRDATRSGDRA